MPNHPGFKEWDVKVVPGGGGYLSACVGIFTNEVPGFYQAVDRVNDRSAGSLRKFREGFPGGQAFFACGYSAKNILLVCGSEDQLE